MFLDIFVKRPERTKLDKKNNQTYVYHVVSQMYLPDKKYAVEKRSCIGKVASEVDGTMYPNENFERYYPGVLEALQGLPHPPSCLIP